MSGTAIQLPAIRELSIESRRSLERAFMSIDRQMQTTAKAATTGLAQQSQVTTISADVSTIQKMIALMQQQIDSLLNPIVPSTPGSIHADEDIQQYQVVYASSAYGASIADQSIAATGYGILGLATNNASAGAEVKIAGPGESIDNDFGFSPGPVYLDTVGGLTQTQPTTGYVAVIGYALPDGNFLVADLEPVYIGADNESPPLAIGPDGMLQEVPFPILPSMNSISSGLTMKVPSTTNLLTVGSLGLEVDGGLVVDGGIVEISA